VPVVVAEVVPDFSSLRAFHHHGGMPAGVEPGGDLEAVARGFQHDRSFRFGLLHFGGSELSNQHMAADGHRTSPNTESE
jgi:hypothetical protein